MITPEKYSTKAGKRWKVRYRLNKRQTSQTFDNEPEALKFAIDLDAYGPERAEADLYDRLANIENPTPTLDAWLNVWLDHSSASKGTRSKYARNYELHISDRLGTLPLNRIDRADAVAFVRHLSEEKELSDKTVANVFSVLAGMMKLARELGEIQADPTAGVTMPRTLRESAEHEQFLTEYEFGLLRENIHPHFLPLVDFAAATGARWGELAALTVRDIDLKKLKVRINKAAKQVDGERVIGVPKTQRSVRTIDFPADVLPTLLLAVKGKKAGDLVFTMIQGGPLLHRTFTGRYWIPACIEAGLTDPRPKFHTLRHSHASWLIGRGVDIVKVSRRLGHSSVQVTDTVYGHLDEDAQIEAAEVAGLVFSGLAIER